MPKYLVTFSDGDRKIFQAKDRTSAEKMARRYSRENLYYRRHMHTKEERQENIRSLERQTD